MRAADVDRFHGVCEAQLAGFRTEFASAEPELSLNTARLPQAPAEALSDATARASLRLLLSLPHGVLAMSRDLPGLVETSSNLARVRTLLRESGYLDLDIAQAAQMAAQAALTAGDRERAREAGELSLGQWTGLPAWWTAGTRCGS